MVSLEVLYIGIEKNFNNLSNLTLCSPSLFSSLKGVRPWGKVT